MTEPVTPGRGGTILGRSKSPTPPGEDVEDVAASFEELAAVPVDVGSPPADQAASEAATGAVGSKEGAREGAAVGEQSTPTPPRGRGPSRWALAGCVVFAAASLVFALFAVQQRSARQAQQDQTNELRDVSGRTVAALTSYDYQHLDQWKQSVLANSTGSFENQFSTAFTGFSQAYVAEHNRGTGAVQGVWLGPVAAGKATTVVLVQITVTSLTGTHSLNPYMQVTLLKVAGRWRVDDVQATVDTSGGATSAPSGGTTGGTTPTSAP